MAGSTTSGFVNGLGTVARLRNPIGISVDTAGNVFIGETSNHVVRKIDTAGH